MTTFLSYSFLSEKYVENSPWVLFCLIFYCYTGISLSLQSSMTNTFWEYARRSHPENIGKLKIDWFSRWDIQSICQISTVNETEWSAKWEYFILSPDCSWTLHIPPRSLSPPTYLSIYLPTHTHTKKTATKIENRRKTELSLAASPQKC